MAWRDWGSTPINSTGAGLVTNPSTSDLIAEIDSTQLGSVLQAGSLFQVSYLLGGSTSIVWSVEQVSSTGLGSTAVRDLTNLCTPANQSGQYILTYKLEKGDRLRCRVQTAFTGFATAKISAEPMT